MKGSQRKLYRSSCQYIQSLEHGGSGGSLSAATVVYNVIGPTKVLIRSLIRFLFMSNIAPKLAIAAQKLMLVSVLHPQ